MSKKEENKLSRWYFCEIAQERVNLEVCLNRRKNGTCPDVKCKILKSRLEMVNKSMPEDIQKDILSVCKKLGGGRVKGIRRAIDRVTTYFTENIWRVVQS